jgi:hypothetical protein
MMFGRLFGGKKGEQRQVHGNKGLNPTKKNDRSFFFFFLTEKTKQMWNVTHLE